MEDRRSQGIQESTGIGSLFRVHFAASIPSAFSEIEGNTQQFSRSVRGDFLQNEQDTGNHATRGTQVTNKTPLAAADDPFDFETAGAFRACLGPDKGQVVPYSAIVEYIECAMLCGGARILYSDCMLKRYECRCEQVAV